jgi:hypothetical protein
MELQSPKWLSQTVMAQAPSAHSEVALGSMHIAPQALPLEELAPTLALALCDAGADVVEPAVVEAVDEVVSTPP